MRISSSFHTTTFGSMAAGFALAEARMRFVTHTMAWFVIVTSSFQFLRLMWLQHLAILAPVMRTLYHTGPPLTSIRLPDGQFHFDAAYPARPILIFGLHLLPAFVWSLIAPMQFNTRFRQRNPKVHAWSGYAFFALSALLDLTGLYMIAIRFTYSSPDRFSLHFGLLPNFDVALSLVGIAFGASMIIAVRAAIHRDFFTHRIAVIVHVCVGMTVHYQRLCMYLQLLIAYVVAAQFPTQFERFLSISTTFNKANLAQIYQYELNAFLLTGYGGAILAFLTAWYALRPIFAFQRQHQEARRKL